MKKLWRYLKKVIFSRFVITMLIIIAQVYFLFACLFWFRVYWPVITAVMSLLSVSVIIYIINRDQNPAFKLSWMIPICTVPFLGTFMYLFVEGNVTTKGIKRAINRRIEESAVYLKQDPEIRKELSDKPCSMSAISQYVENAGGFPTYKNTDVTYLPSGEAFLADLLEKLETAEHFIFLEYFIVAEGYMWDSVLEILKKKVEQGVEVKLMIDGTCTWITLPNKYTEKMKSYGIDTRVFLPVVPIFSTHQNNRDHRKIIVIDGKTAYTGGTNLADEYINQKTLHGHWKDVAVRLDGDAVRTITVLFLQLWNVGDMRFDRRTFQPGEYEKYLVQEKSENLICDRSASADAAVDAAAAKDGILGEGKRAYVMPYGDGPNSYHNLAENVYLDIMNRANRYIHVMSPYFINDHEIITAFKYAAERGTDVKLILPHIPDKKFAFDVARTYYPALLKAGVKIYEYTPGFVHAKVFVSDDNKAVVGSINLDFRSLYHHYECAAYFYRCDAVLDVEKDFQETLAKSQLVTMEYYKSIPWYRRLSGQVLKLFAPLF